MFAIFTAFFITVFTIFKIVYCPICSIQLELQIMKQILSYVTASSLHKYLKNANR